MTAWRAKLHGLDDVTANLTAVSYILRAVEGLDGGGTKGV